MEDFLDHELVISDIVQMTPAVKLFEIRRKDRQPLPAFTAGAHIRVQVPNGMVRKYSLCNDANQQDCYQIAVKREAQGRGGSISLWDEAQVGDSIAVSAPSNAFELVEPAKAYMFIAGGIGITPLLSMIRTMGDLPAAPWKLYYLTRDRDNTPFLQDLIDTHWPGKVILHHTKSTGKRLDLWPILEKENTAHVYCCGSPELMAEVKDMTGHWNPKFVHFESFDDAVVAKPDDVPFTVKCTRSGLQVEVPVGKSILQVLNEQGVKVPFSCESGTCGTCKTPLLQGQADHRDWVLLPEEQQSQIMICVSRAKSAVLEIDL